MSFGKSFGGTSTEKGKTLHGGTPAVHSSIADGPTLRRIKQPPFANDPFKYLEQPRESGSVLCLSNTQASLKAPRELYCSQTLHVS